MNKLSLVLTLNLAAATLLAADGDLQADVKAAVKRLADAPNYSWTTTSKAEGAGANVRLGPFDGKAEKNGCTYFAGALGETRFAVALKGEKFAVQQGEEWKSSAEIEDERTARRIKSFKAPAAEAADLAGQAPELKKTADGAVAGSLSEEAVKQIFSRWSSREVTGAKGTVKFWLKEGALVKYEYRQEGTIKGGEGRDDTEVDRTTTVEIKDVGKTKLELSAEVRKMIQ